MNLIKRTCTGHGGSQGIDSASFDGFLTERTLSERLSLTQGFMTEGLQGYFFPTWLLLPALD